MNSPKKPMVFVVGTTASGKSDWALRWAQEFSGGILNCDSVQVYKSLDIGAAKPSLQERQQSPHYLYDYVAEGATATAGDYARDFFACAESLREKAGFVVGGTGFYFQAIEKGMYPVIKTSPILQKEIADLLATPEGPGKLYEEFRRLDPEAAAKIHERDHYRLGRAMELIRSEGKSVTQIQREFASQQNPFPYPLLKIGIRWDREVLRQRVRLRTEKMLAAGLVEEVQKLLDRGLGQWPALQSVGYREVLEYLEGGNSLQDRTWLVEEIAKNTMALAKRQRTWFQRDKNIQWFEGDTGFSEARRCVEAFLLKSWS
jgi:tRNA dimethylallyltransferase